MFTKKTLTTLTGSCLVAATAALQAPAAFAIPINITSIISSWTNADPASVGGIGTNTISWGSPATPAGQSSYVFDPALAPSVALGGLLPNDPFELGTFTHNNFPIRPPLLNTAELTVEIEFDVLDAGAVIDTRTISSVFDFTHLETPNGDPICADGNAQGVAPNQNGCADRVTFASSASTEFFTLAGINYEFNISGFSQPAGGIVDEFWTVESQSNSAVLIAEYAVRTNPVPVPGALWLLMTGLAAVAAARGAKRSAKI